MKPTALQLRRALQERLAALRDGVDVRLLRPGDLVEYLDAQGAWRSGRIVRVQRVAGCVVVGGYARADFPRGDKDLARYGRKNRVVLALQVTGLLVRENGRHVVVRPGTSAWDELVAARGEEDGGCGT